MGGFFPDNNGGGFLPDMRSSGSPSSLSNGGTVYWNVDSSGHLIPTSDGLQDLGSTSFGVRGIYIGTDNVLIENNAGFIQLPGMIISTPSLGVRATGGYDIVVAGGNARFNSVTGGANQFDLASNGTTRISGNATGIGFFTIGPVAQQVSAANLTNNVTSGGTDNTVDNVVAAAVDTSAASLVSTRDAVYQLARKLKQVNDGLRAYGLLT